MKAIFNLILLLGVTHHGICTEIQAKRINETISCQANQTIFSNGSQYFLKCTASLTSFSNKKHLPSCENYDSKSIYVVAPYHNDLIFQHVLCVSNHPIFLKLDYQDGKPNEAFLNIQWRRKFTNITSPETYSYELKMFPPSGIIQSFDNVVVKYGVYNRHFFQDKIYILWFLISIEFTVVLGKSLILNVTATGEIINIPCITSNPEQIRFFRKITNSNALNESYDQLIPVDNSSLSYHPVHGFSLNTNLIPNFEGLFSCVYIHLKIPRNFNISRQPDFVSWSEYHHLSLNPPNLRTPFHYIEHENKNDSLSRFLSYDTTFTFLEPQFDLICISKRGNVTFQILENETTTIMKDIVYSNWSRPEETFLARVTSPETILKRKYEIQCIDSSTQDILQFWQFEGKRKLELSDVDFGLVIKFGLDVNTNSLKCIAPGLSRAEMEFRQIECVNAFTCKELASAVFEANSIATRVYNSEMCYPYKIDERCKSLQPLKKGFFQCSVTYLKGIKPTYYQDTYFFGFDGKFYLGNVPQPPVSAIMKIELVNRRDVILPVPGKFIFSCEAHSFYFEHEIQWMIVFFNHTEVLVPQGNLTDLYNSKMDSENALKANLKRISQIHLEDISVYKISCVSPMLSILNDTNQYKWRRILMEVTLTQKVPPTILTSKEKLNEHFRIGEANRVLKCEVAGFPIPDISWTLGGKTIEFPFVINHGVNYKLLQFPDYNRSLAGDYVCSAKNEAGFTNKTYTVQTYIESPTAAAWSYWNIFAIATSVCLIVVIIILYVYVRRLREQSKNQLTEEEIRQFREGIITSADKNENSPLSLPYDENVEMQRNQFSVDERKVLGEGAFGIVYEGTVTLETYTGRVAFKTVRPHCKVEILKSLLSELKIMIYIGQHENIIRFISAYTQEIENGILYIATELCSLGSLLEHLQTNEEILSHDVDVDLTSGDQHGYSMLTSKLTKFTEKFNNWSAQIANGMHYLEAKHVVHSDLATRNILLTSDEIVKITDFGLSRRMYNYHDYVKKAGKKDPLPWKWMSIESLRKLIFSRQSDVWSYGITIWEIFSFGAVPYPGISWTVQFIEMLANGLRNPKPTHADSKVYNVMLSCWAINPKERPSFLELKTFFTELPKNQDVALSSVDHDSGEFFSDQSEEDDVY